MRRAESRAMRERIAKAITSNDNQLTSRQLQDRFPRAPSGMVRRVAQDLGIKLPQSELLGVHDMEPFREDQGDCIERLKMQLWRRGGNEHTPEWAEKWRERGG